MKEIMLSNGFKVTVDDEDYSRLSLYTWNYIKTGNNEYAIRYGCVVDRTYNILMHRDIMGITDQDIKIDHRNGNGLCNEKWNLRTCTTQQNYMNRCSKPNSASKYNGVFKYKDKKGIKWRARIEHNGKAIHLGYFRQEDLAALDYNKKAQELFGEFAYLNIIKGGEQSCQLS